MTDQTDAMRAAHARFLFGPRDWREDAAHENGDYQRGCIRCGKLFIGHKRRVVCRACAHRKPPLVTRAMRRFRALAAARR
jgi:DNA-directed RNA polymerase subunit RPC12/RpoP